MNIPLLIHWGPNPAIVSFGPLTIRWYGAFFAIGFMSGFRIMQKVFAREGRDQMKLESLLLYLVLGTTIGARLGHCLFYEPAEYLANPIRILYIWEGGLASHGGTLGNIFAMWLFVRRYKEFDFLWLVDRLAYPTALVSCFIRLGNVMNSEILGLPTGGNWGVVFDLHDQVPRHPAQLYESIVYLITFFVMRHLYWKTEARNFRGRMFGVMLCFIFGARVVIEHFKENQVPFENAMAINMGQLLSVPFVLVGIWLIVTSARRPAPVEVVAAKKKKRS